MHIAIKFQLCNKNMIFQYLQLKEQMESMPHCFYQQCYKTKQVQEAIKTNIHVIIGSIKQYNINFPSLTQRPKQNGWHFADDIFKCISLNGNLVLWFIFTWNFEVLTCQLASKEHIYGLMQERRYSIANALELRLLCTNPLIYKWKFCSLFKTCHIINSFVNPPNKQNVNYFVQASKC